MHGEAWSEKDKEYLKLNYKTKSVKEIAEFLQRNICSVHTYAGKLGLSQLINKNKNYFDIPNIENSYWAGFIAADGCITRNDSVSIQLSSLDKEHLINFAKCCGYGGDIKEVITTTGYKPGCITSVIRVSGVKNWVIKLKENWSITPKKTLTLEPPTNLNYENSLAFIKGYIDGDGHIIEEDGRYIVLGVIGTEKMLIWIKNTFDNLIIKENSSNLLRCNNCVQYRYSIKGVRAIKIINSLRLIKTPQLERKWNLVAKYDENQKRITDTDLPDYIDKMNHFISEKAKI